MRIVTGIASTTHVDAHNDRFTKAALEGGAEQIRARYIPYLVDHDFNRQIGVLLCGRVEPLIDGEFGLMIVAGLFEEEVERQHYVNGAPNIVWQRYLHHLDDAQHAIELLREHSREEAEVKKHNSEDIAAQLETHLDSTSIWIDGRVYQVKHLVASTGDLSIHVYPKDHPPAHFHVVSKQRGIDARFSLDTLEPINVKEGALSSRDAKKIRNFFETHPDQVAKLRSEHARMQ